MSLKLAPLQTIAWRIAYCISSFDCHALKSPTKSKKIMPLQRNSTFLGDEICCPIVFYRFALTNFHLGSVRCGFIRGQLFKNHAYRQIDNEKRLIFNATSFHNACLYKKSCWFTTDETRFSVYTRYTTISKSRRLFRIVTSEFGDGIHSTCDGTWDFTARFLLNIHINFTTNRSLILFFNFIHYPYSSWGVM